MSVSAEEVYRSEALEAQEGAVDKPGAPLALFPQWVPRTYWLILAVVSVALSFGLGARVGEYAEGPAVVRVEGRLDLPTPMGGVVSRVEVQSGDRVKRGQVLVQFQTTAEQLEYDSLSREFEAKLARVLVNPADEAARQSLTSLRTSRDLAEARMRERAVVAPRDGVVGNLRIRIGQTLAPGDVVASLVDEGQAIYSVLALVPGQFRPMLKRGMTLRFALDGFPYVYSYMPVEAIGDTVVGPSEVRRFLGQELGDTLAVTGGYVLVRARLPKREFVYEGKPYNYYDGIPGKADVKVRSTPVLMLLLPALKAVFNGQ
jgi:multidrug efflux pump subunit AcrA (membrane-fusion protein)